MESQEVSVFCHRDVLLVLIPMNATKFRKVQSHSDLVCYPSLLSLLTLRRHTMLFADHMFVENLDRLIPEPFDDGRWEEEHGEFDDEFE